MYIRQREQNEIISRIGDIFLNAATEFRLAYPTYIGQMPGAEKRLKEEIESNGEFRMFLEVCTRFSRMYYRPSKADPLLLFLKRCFRHPDNVNRMDLKHWLNRPSEHLHKYPIVFEAIRAETAEGDPDTDFLKAAVEAMKNLQSVAQLRIFQKGIGKGSTGWVRWHNLVPEDVRNGIGEQESKRQT
jgi:RHO1 GDP-GTP exchange protein 1/2